MEIVIEKSEKPILVETDIEIGGYYKTSGNPDVYRRVLVDHRKDDFNFTCDNQEHKTVYRGGGAHVAHPCDAAGNLLEQPGVAKVRADTLASGDTCLDKDGDIRILCEIDDRRNWDAVGIGEKNETWVGYIKGDSLVTPCTIKKIVVEMGGAG